MEVNHGAENYFFGELEGEQRKAFEKHLDGCTACQQKLKFLKIVHQEMASSSPGGKGETDIKLDCLSLETLAEFIDGSLDRQKEAAALAHIVDCFICRRALLELLELSSEPLKACPADPASLSYKKARARAGQEEGLPPGKKAFDSGRPAYSRLIPWCVAAGLLFVALLVFTHQFPSAPRELLVNEPLNLRSVPAHEDWKEGTRVVSLGGASPAFQVLMNLRKSWGQGPGREAMEEALKKKSFILKLVNALDLKELTGGREVSQEDLLQRVFVILRCQSGTIFDFFEKENLARHRCRVKLSKKMEEDGNYWNMVMTFFR